MELPRLEHFWKKYRDRGLSVVAIEAYYDTEGAVEFIRDNNLTYHLLENGKGDNDVVRNIFSIALYSTSYILDSDGRIVFVHQGWHEGSEEQVEEEITQLLGDRAG